MRRQFIRLFLLFSCMLSTASGALAGTGIIVTTADDAVAIDGQCSLREAIINANNNDQSGSPDCFAGDPVAPDTIYFDPGLAGATISLNGTALPTITEQLAIVGPGKFDPDALTLDAGGASRIFVAQGGTPSDFELRLVNLTLTGGTTAGPQEHGGALFVDNADLELNSVKVTDSATSGFQAWGGGVAVLAGNAVLNRATIAGNATGGNLAGGGGLAVNGELTLMNSMVADNQTMGDAAIGGGALAGGDTLIFSSTLYGNGTTGTSAHGGGITVLSGLLLLMNSTVSGNRIGGASAEGAGAYVSAGILSLMHSTIAFNRNEAGGVGGVVKASTHPAHSFGLFNSLLVQDTDGGAACNQPADNHTGSRATDASCTGSGDPLDAFSLLPLADNGGITPTHAFFSPSAALNQAGDCQAQFGIDQDQRGQPRPGADTAPVCDIGAFELQGPIESGLQITPAAVDFGTVAVGETSPPATVTLAATGNAVLNIQHIEMPLAPFSLTGGTCDEAPATMAPGQSCTLDFTFAPAAPDMIGQTLEIVSDAPDSPHNIMLSGQGQNPGDDIFADRFEQ